MLERDALDELHLQVGPARMRVTSKTYATWSTQPDDGSSFPEDAPDGGIVLLESREEHFQRDQAAGTLMLRLVDVGKASAADVPRMM